MTTHRAIPCPCGQRACAAWAVDPLAAIHGVSFTEQQARAVAALLNMMEKKPIVTAPRKDRPELTALFLLAIAHYDAMTPEEKIAMHHAQRQSWARQDKD